ncbi:MAG: hypothetical protein DRH90_20100 [Deltaproteobacteria bacterium]|nr:MAG: hypothetical protein DRH90_20100 [Deltaproteobacteria bacterium]
MNIWLPGKRHNALEFITSKPFEQKLARPFITKSRKLEITKQITPFSCFSNFVIDFFENP